MDLSYGPEYEAFREEVRSFVASNWPLEGGEQDLPLEGPGPRPCYGTGFRKGQTSPDTPVRQIGETSGIAYQFLASVIMGNIFRVQRVW